MCYFPELVFPGFEVRLCALDDAAHILPVAPEHQRGGAGAVNQALKSVAVARGYLTPGGIDIVCVPAFTSVEVGDETKTAMKLIVEVR